jgi:hypothetical protein
MSGTFFRTAFLVAALSLSAVPSVWGQDKADPIAGELKRLQLQDIKSGRMRIKDVYFLKEMELEGRLKLGIKVIQLKSVVNTQSCGVLGLRFVSIYEAQNGAEVVLDQAQFEEFVGVKNYLMKFEDNWENMKEKKFKEIDYSFDISKDPNGNETNFESFVLNGNKMSLSMSLLQNKKATVLFRSKSLKEIAELSQNLDHTLNFLRTNNFGECL